MWGETPPQTLVLLADSYDEFLDRLRRDQALATERVTGAETAGVGGSARAGVRSADVAELRLAVHLLGELQAFPDAVMADILDVRERLRDARVGFRAAMARAGRELADVPPDEFRAAAGAYAREHVEPAVLGVREQLKELRAGPTLLRAVREPWAVPTVTSLAIATSMLDPGAVVGAGGSASAVAFAARELLTRRGVRKQVRQQPFWYLREAGRALDDRTRRSR